MAFLVLGLLVVGVTIVALVGYFVLRDRPARAISIDSFVLSEPWRRHVASSQSIQRSYTAIVAGTPPGPLQDRLTAIAAQLQQSVEECWQIANRGDEVDEAIHRLKPSAITAQLERATDDASRASLQAQLDSAERLRALRDDTDQQLTSLNTRLGELVSQAAEVSIGVDSTATLGAAVDDVVTQLHALRLAVDEVNNPGRPSTSP